MEVNKLIETVIDDIMSGKSISSAFNEMENKKKVEQAMNNIYAGVVNMGDNSTVNANNSALQGGMNNTLTFDNSHREQTEKIISEIEALSDTLGESREEVLSEVARMKVQLQKPQPKAAIITSALETIKNILTGVAANQATPHVVAGIGNLLKLLGA